MRTIPALPRLPPKATNPGALRRLHQGRRRSHSPGFTRVWNSQLITPYLDPVDSVAVRAAGGHMRTRAIRAGGWFECPLPVFSP